MGAPITYNEQELVVALKERNNQAYTYLYDNYAGALFSIIRQIITDNPELAADVLQEAFINIWRRIETYDQTKGRLFTWMLNVARNASIDTLRSKSYQNSQKNQDLPDNVYKGTDSQSTRMNVDHIGLRKVLEKLKPEHRVLVELSYFKGFTHEEIAEMQDIPLGTVKTRIRNALLQLREYLQ
ncbi:MAG: sigma-70 family RNA polymerase sigma factor [Bacteroidota bacterium]|nr:sigma-70 family RNA polymerase sigma factor [Bacteroidota bacterium]MDP4216162.1 sigma-70 family RNA polymerase sigma factor [Bacteroidota bacterium]MDP4246461.1 sigma-70 family RNA polymerase sigma factor [Bacteroidota bacterium]MDP4255222.1 sigma-70 family RNA polymerase sigma factor [Bacteroidota bacterium]MDP4258346.1 sigma-70 family RNA polymerase sigma factor [Bacteroidota bacterium]